VEGFDDTWDDVADKLNAVLYNPAVGHLFNGTKIAGVPSFRANFLSIEES
jgi:hypothetical protein